MARVIEEAVTFRLGLVGKKIGMTQVFVDNVRIPVTVLELGPNTVVQKKTKDGKDGYDAVQLGYGQRPHRNITKAMAGHYKRADVKPQWVLREFRLPAGQVGELNVGQQIKADLFQEGQMVDVTGTSKGKGFQGVMKRHNMKGSKQWTHGTHEYFRHGGSVGCRTTPGRIHLGKRMGGQMGNERVTTQNLKIVKIDLEKNVVLIAGSVPGARNSTVVVRPAVKAAAKKLHKEARG